MSRERMRTDDMIEDVFADVRVDCGEGVVEEDDVATLVDGAGEANPLFLSTAQIDPLKSKK